MHACRYGQTDMLLLVLSNDDDLDVDDDDGGGGGGGACTKLKECGFLLTLPSFLLSMLIASQNEAAKNKLRKRFGGIDHLRENFNG
jgi:hypothetical protein